MADFKIGIAESQFEKLGVRVGFNEDLYGELLDELAPEVPTDRETINVGILPAPIWGAPFMYRLVSSAAIARNEGDFPGQSYYPQVAGIDVRASEKVDETNFYLLYATRKWAADMNGDLERADQLVRDRRTYRRTVFSGNVGGLAALGYAVGSAEGAVIGGLTGAVSGTVAAVRDTQRNPYFREWNEFVENPEVVAKFGRIISYEAV